MALYEIRVNGKKADESKRVDHATSKFNAVVIKPGQTKSLHDMSDGTVIMTESVDVPEVAEAEIAGAVAEIEPRLPEEKKRKPKEKRQHHNGDQVAQLLHPLSIDQVGDLTKNLYEQACQLTRPGKKGPVNLMTPAKRNRDAANIEKAIRRAHGIGEYGDDGDREANPGSARMSLGLMIRKYVGMGVAVPAAD